MSENSQAFQNEQTPEKLCVDLIEYIIHSIIEAEEISSRPAGSISSHSTHPISTHHASLEDNLIDSVDLIHQRNPIARANVEQWRCYQQANNHSCGYYALHNILTSLEWFHHKGLTTSSAPLHQLIRNGALFLKSFHRIQAQIRAIAQKKDTGFYPWREKDISSGLLEREYARMLFINPKDEIIFRWKHNITVVSSFGLNEMMNGALFHTQVHSLDATFLKFRSPPSHIEDRGYMHGFLIGLTCHWISLLCIREPNKEDIKVLVFDSRNRPVLSKSVHEIEEILKNHAPPNMDPWRHLVRRNSYVDILLATSIIARCAMGEYRFMTLYNHFLIVGLVKNFVSSIPSSFMEDHNAAINTEMQSDAFRICDASSFSRMASCFMAAFWQLQESPVIHASLKTLSLMRSYAQDLSLPFGRLNLLAILGFSFRPTLNIYSVRFLLLLLTYL
eukprot:TRINITY_DN877_c0_g1_i6.p1 TRINITY_DN877_c0_g1~~TRINITY_DN877_c0_g1_i6.p1  ORF type:complete len:446 (-),score=82.23 TRINITY_DN877_c0_g1_i6:607-1944(-)